jgi:DNA (cytosine-5)-methyltransferase 1
MPIAVDLFSGAGGLTRGLALAGFSVGAGVELNANAAKTYQLNNRSTIVFNQSVRSLSGAAIKEAVGGNVALLAACPPCQGFTSLTSKLSRVDPRNNLPREVVRLAREIKPAAIMFENVPRLATSPRNTRRFKRLLSSLEDLGYRTSWAVLEAADFGTAQFRSRLIVFGARREIDPPTPTHAREAHGKVKAWRTLEDAIKGEGAAALYDPGKPLGKTLRDWHVVRRLAPLNKARLAAARPGAPRWELPDELRPDCHKGSSAGFANVYGRMVWDQPSPTITGGCTSPSKGRFGHPTRARTISVMEAGMLQDFPKGHRIAADGIDEVCQMIGNAFPARLAAAAARQFESVL